MFSCFSLPKQEGDQYTWSTTTCSSKLRVDSDETSHMKIDSQVYSTQHKASLSQLWQFIIKVIISQKLHYVGHELQ